MRAIEFIRNILDLLDNFQADIEPSEDYQDECSPDEEASYSNSPDEHYADIKKVTVDAGGGVNGPKHPSDLRAVNTSMYPNMQYQPKE